MTVSYIFNKNGLKNSILIKHSHAPFGATGKLFLISAALFPNMSKTILYPIFSALMED